jgi:exonuclease SbcC
MRPHALRLTAFGPFAATVSVDLDALAASGLFLLHGATGAGKTTLLDGIGFALFGRVPGVRNDAKQLRSDYAAAGVRPEVQLDATCGGRRIRVTRSPSWDRPKARGTGTTTEQARVLLEELRDGTWTTLSTRPREADDEIADLVGMSAEQFFQVVLLPQGDFARFLRAPSVERAKLLQKLFATERFADVEAWLAGRRRALSERTAAARDAVDLVVARLAEASGALVPDAAPLPWASALLDSAGEQESLAAQEVSHCTLRRDQLRVLADDAARLAALQTRRRLALERQTALAATREERLALQLEVDGAARAAEVAGALAAVGSRRADRDAALQVEVAARSAADAHGIDVGELRARVAAGQARVGLIESLRAVDARRLAALAEAGLAGAEHADALAQVADLELQLALLPARRDQAGALLTTSRAASLALPALRAQRAQLAALRPDLVRLGQVTASIAGLVEADLSARETWLSLENKATDLRIANVNSMIAALAFRLEDGVPCDVCGSPVHPDPSQLRHEGVSSDDEERAKAAADAAHEQVSEVQSRLAAEQATLEDLLSRTASWTLAALDTELSGVDLEIDVVVASADRVPAVEKELAAVDGLLASFGKEQVAAAGRADAAARRTTEASGRAAVAAQEIAAVLGASADVESALAAAGQLVTRLSAAVAAVEALTGATVELDRATALAETACTAAGFTTSVDALAAARSTDWRATSAGGLRAAADASAAVLAELADPALDIALEPPAPVASTAGAVVEADEVLAAAQHVAAQRAHARTRLHELLPLLTAALDGLGPLEQDARDVRALADLCAGQGANGLKMTLVSYVLAARLEEVAAAASGRLLTMTQGRYSLVHTDGAARGGLRSGLGLLARDGWSGQDRDTATLSGGETFLASLALALGLADVVAAEAGGSRIGALFVDEGFGTLDEDTLDEVMDVLDGLREGGRVVGLVSHVSELRQRIPAQVEVTKTRAGSAVVLHGC